MRKTLSLSVAIVATAFTGLVGAQQEPTVDVLVAVGPGVSGTDAVTAAFDLNLRANSIMASSDMADRSYRFRPYVVQADYDLGAGAYSRQAVDFITDMDDLLLTSARETGSLTLPPDVAGFDLVVLLVEDMVSYLDPTKRACGAADTFFDSEVPVVFGLDPGNPQNSNSRFGIVLNYHPDCINSVSKVIAHEIGHIMGGDHQFLLPGDSCPDDPGDCLPNWPVIHNHPAIFYGGALNFVAQSTVMGASVSYPMTLRYSTSEPGKTISGGYDAGDSTKDMVRVFDTTWEQVAAYRPYPSSPVECDLTIEFVGCNGPVSGYIVTAGLFGYDVYLADYDMQYPGSTIWTDIYEGALTCPAAVLNPGTWLRALLYTTSGSSECTIYVPTTQNCDPNEGPWGY